ncbi:MAG TPA: PPE domain-containing protein, partial [Mycobacterium sp.]|nr:PPE domain-containing protein [Mycobacterium sp.]
TLLMFLIATNILGQNTPAIAATELEYLEMWAQDVAAMTGYHAGAMSVAATLPSFSAPPVGLAGLGAGLGNILSSLVSWLSGLLPVGGLAGLAGQVQTFIAGIPVVLTNAVTQLSTTLSVVPLTSLAQVAQVAQVGMVPASMVASPMMSLAQVANGAGLASPAATGMAEVPQFVGSSVPQMNVLGGAASGLGPVGAGLGNARLVGAISVPSTWQGAMPMRMATPVTSGLGAGLTSAAAAEAAEVAPAAGTPMTPMPMGVNGMPGKTDRASPHVVPTRPTVVPRTGVG